jgi:hypothetical protein
MNPLDVSRANPSVVVVQIFNGMPYLRDLDDALMK